MFGIGVLCLLGIVLVFINAKKTPVSMPSKGSSKYSSASSIKQNEADEAISLSEAYLSRQQATEEFYAGDSDIENGEPLAIDTSDRPSRSIGAFIDVDSLETVETDRPPRSIGEFIDVDSLETVETDRPPRSIGAFIDVDSLETLETDMPPRSIGEYISDDP
jgi:hypothetical protein